MQGHNSDIVMNGTFGEVWFDGEYMAEVKKCRLEVAIEYTEIGRVRNLTPGQKMTALKPEGEVTFNKVSSTVTKKVAAKLKKGQAPKFTIISNLDDPAALGAERVAAYGCAFEKMTLADWENGSLTEENYSFKFENYELLDTV